MSFSAMDRRLAGRLDCRVPVRLSAGKRVLHTETVNLSRVGVLLRIPVAELGLAAPASLGTVAEELTRILGDIATAEFRYDVLGALVCRTLRLVRIGRSDPDGEWVEVGCALRRPLMEDEVDVLNLALPPMRVETAAVTAEDEAALSGTPSIQLVLCCEPGHHARPLMATALEVCAESVRAAVDDLRPLPARGGGKGVGPILASLAETYGAAPIVVLMRSCRPMWSGSACIQMVELNPLRGGLDLQMAFSRSLSVPELARLGLN